MCIIKIHKNAEKRTSCEWMNFLKLLRHVSIFFLWRQGGGRWARNWWQNYLYFREFKFSVFYELVWLIKNNKTYPWSNSFLQHNYILHFKIQLLEVRNSFKRTCQLLWISLSYATYMVSDNTTLNINFFKIIRI